MPRSHAASARSGTPWKWTHHGDSHRRTKTHSPTTHLTCKRCHPTLTITNPPCTSHANDVTQRDGHHTEDTHTKDAPHTQTMSSSGTDHTHLNGYVTRSRKDTLTKEAPHILTVSPNGTDDTHLNGYVTPSHEDTPQRRTSHANDVMVALTKDATHMRTMSPIKKNDTAGLSCDPVASRTLPTVGLRVACRCRRTTPRTRRSPHHAFLGWAHPPFRRRLAEGEHHETAFSQTHVLRFSFGTALPLSRSLQILSHSLIFSASHSLTVEPQLKTPLI